MPLELSRERLLLALIVVLSIASYARTLAFAFVWDDVPEIADNKLLDGPLFDGLQATQHEHMGVHYSDTVRPVHDSYRPLRYLSYRFDVALFGRSSAAMHAHNLVLAALCLAAAYWFLWEWGLPAGLRVFGVGLLALHPLCVETVAYVSARSDLMAAFAVLCTCAAGLRVLGGNSLAFWPIAIASYASSLASKEAYLALPFVLVIRAYQEKKLRRFAWFALGLSATAAVWFSLRAEFVRSSGEGRALEALGRLGPVFFEYIKATLAPFDCSIVRPVAEPDWLLTLALIAGYAALGGYTVYRPASGPAKLFAAVLWFALALGPAVLAASITGIASDRYAYLTLLTWPLAGASCAVRFQALTVTTRRGLLAALACLCLIQLVVTERQIEAWRNARSLYEHAVETQPDSAPAWFGLGHALIQDQGCQVAEPIFAHAVTLDPHHVRALNNLGVCQLRRSALPDAERSFRAVLEHAKGIHPRAWVNLAQIHLSQGRNEEACGELRKGLEIDPGYTLARELAARFCASP